MAVLHIRRSIILLTVISTLAVTARGQSPAKPQAGIRFESIKNAFEVDAETLTKTRGVDGYNPADVNATLQQTKDATLSSIPPKDKPLRVYVERSFPEPVNESTPVQRDVVESRFSLVRELLGGIR